ncbi:hypothetical protein [Pararhodonellum marinum]|uniref:hypothetical protein n=1 Tax=Pararhodonellum marinum TaxID=2755358 RepID=UPI0018901737|nr:hypothetical protein [Pararhodonellum marinum]
MKKIIYLCAGLLFTMSACDSPNRQTEDRDGTLSDRDGTTDMDRRTGDTDRSNTGVETLFTTTYEDLVEDKQSLEKDFMELKQERTARAGQASSAYDSLMKNVEEKIQALDKKATEFRAATSDDQKDRIKKEFDMIEDEADERIRHIKNNYKDNN